MFLVVALQRVSGKMGLLLRAMIYRGPEFDFQHPRSEDS